MLPSALKRTKGADMVTTDVDRIMNKLRREMQADKVVYVDADYIEKFLRREALMEEKGIGERNKPEPRQVTLEEHMNMLLRRG